MTAKNKFGLSRHIPEKVARKVRQNCKFGCVICRSFLYTYEHIDPKFSEAKEHHPDHICLLCGNCQNLSSKGRLPKFRIREAYNKIKNDDNPGPPTDNEFFNLYKQNARIDLGSCSFEYFDSIINIDHKNVLSCSPTKLDFPPYFVTGQFYDKKGQELFNVIDNEWVGPIDVWDVTQIGNRLSIKDQEQEILFQAQKKANENIIKINRLNMWFPPFHVIITPKGLILGQYAADGTCWVYFEFRDWVFTGGDCAIHLDSTAIATPKIGDLIIGGRWGTHIQGTGIHVGRGDGMTCITKYTPENGMGDSFLLYNHNCKPIKYSPPPKKRKPPKGVFYFVLGHLEVKEIKMPRWTEKAYYLNGHWLSEKPISWGIVKKENGRDIGLYYLNPNEPRDWESDENFIGYYADDVLKQIWADKVFEVTIEEIDPEGYKYTRRVKRSEVGRKKVISEFNKKTGCFHHPIEVQGITLWKDLK